MPNLDTILARVRPRLENWWDHGDQEHPCIIATVCANAGLPDTDDLERFWTDEDLIIDRKMAELDQTQCLGLAVPSHYIDQGSSAMACALGCPMEFVDKETVWAEPYLSSVNEILGLQLDPENSVYARIAEIAPLVRAVGSRGVLAIITDATEDNMAQLLNQYPQTEGAKA